MFCGYGNIRTIKDFKDYIKNKSVSVIGLGVSNISLIDFLKKCGVKKITVRDKKTEVQKIPEDLLEINYILGENYLDNLKEDVIFKTPVIRRDLNEFTEAVKNGSVITSEIELFFMLCPAKTIAVTGSEGKTTTTTIIGEILKAAGKKTYVGGNIGAPLLNQVEGMTKEDYAVLELSSFQLFDLDNNNFSPDYAVITNITPNHLDWHKDMDEYINAKKIIFKNQKESGRLVLSFENNITRNITAQSSKIFFSNNNKSDIYCDGKYIFIKLQNGEDKKILSRGDIFIKGEHNILNFMAAIGVTHDIAGNEAIINAAKNFRGVPHRIEFVREINGVDYYNSTIDSTPTRTIAALNNFDCDINKKIKNIIVILGGYDKKISFEPLAPVVYKKAKAAVLYGETKNKIKECLDNYKKNNNNCEELIIKTAGNFDSAVIEAKELANRGDIVLLSPACASFGDFKNFEERGERFKKLTEGF
ncbi:MAG: UDP-N-acetylmuramoyl-L-alanine--D-glutamate ligase [Oscillospiraceae bacterium]|nr:UDP-N-acetylmuramoyl-L-alanine--D-glutamate ligase [Oscillospiraceae bacterium]